MMAGISSEILTNLMRSNLNNLKSFAEQLNAELTEDGQEDECRDSHKMNVSLILQKFGEAEAYFEKGIRCLRKVDTEAKKKLLFDDTEHVEESVLLDEIKSIVRLVEGRERTADEPEQFIFERSDENRINHQLDNIKDILNEIHPLQLADHNNEDHDSEDENRMVFQLEEMQKRAMTKSMNRVTDNEEEEVRMEEDENFNESDDEELNVGIDSFERVTNGRCYNVDVESNKIEQIWNTYKQDMIEGSLVDIKQLFYDKIVSETDINFEKLPFFSKYNESILELFSKEAIVVLEEKQNYTDPISKTAIQNPVRNKICQHIYEQDTIYSILKKKKSMACPCLGCSCRSFTMNDLEEDEETATKITQNLARAQALRSQIDESIAEEDAETDREDENTDSEVYPEDDTQSQEIL